MAKDTTNHSIFAHMNDEEVAECYEMYRSNEMKNTEIIELYELGNISASALLKQFPMIQTNLKCPLCGEALLERPTGKTGYSREHCCPSCKHELYGGKEDPRCPCEHCVATREEEARKRREAQEIRYQDNLAQLATLYPVPSTHIPYANLSLIDKVYLASMIPLGSRDYLPSQEVAAANSALSPAGKLDGVIYRHLQDRNIIFPAVEKLPRELILYPSKSTIERTQSYCLNVVMDNQSEVTCDQVYHRIVSDFEGIMRGKISVSAEDVEQIIHLIEHVEVAEAAVFLSHYCNKYNLPEPPAKTYDIIRGLLIEMSVAQLAFFLYVSVKNAASFFMTGDSKGKQHAVNTIPNKIEQLVNRKKEKSEAFSRWDRLYSEPKSNLANTLYDKLFVHLNLGFYQSVRDIASAIEQFFELVVKKEIATPAAIADQTSTDALLCSACSSSSLQLLDSQKGVLVFCLECNGTQLLQPATEN